MGNLKVAGIDIGSRTIALVDLNAGAGKPPWLSVVEDTGYDPLARCREILDGRRYDLLLATGYGRHLAKANFADDTVTEIRAYAVGAQHLRPESRAILDIGGQDVKVISLEASGKVRDFEMNDRCAAGTGKFLEVMAKALGFSIEKLGEEALKAKNPTKINSMCTVFAESEVVSLISKGEDRRDIAYGIHQAICERIMAILNRVGVEGELFFAGGVALNVCMREILAERLSVPVFVPDNPQIVGALGAALCALRRLHD